jgi:hypothetical protein
MADKYLRIIDRSYTQFLNSLDSKSIESYFNINKYKIKCVQQDLLNYTLTIHDTYIPELYVLLQTNLPVDVIQYLYYFLIDSINIISTMVFTKYYPFRPYTCKIVSYSQIKYDKQLSKIHKKTENPQLSLEVDFYNRQLIDSWMTCSSFNNNILCYITYILDKIY